MFYIVLYTLGYYTYLEGGGGDDEVASEAEASAEETEPAKGKRVPCTRLVRHIRSVEV